MNSTSSSLVAGCRGRDFVKRTCSHSQEPYPGKGFEPPTTGRSSSRSKTSAAVCQTRTPNPSSPFGERRGRNRSGLGLGLSISRKAVKTCGGDIHVRQPAGKGCVFTIELPLADHEGKAVGTGDKERGQPRAQGSLEDASVDPNLH
jgi:hypothetical protein